MSIALSSANTPSENSIPATVATAKKSTARAWLVVISASLFFFYEFMQMTVFNSISGDLMQTFNITAAQFGALSAGYFYANVIFLFPAGIALDRFSTRRLIITGLSICTLATIGMACSPYYGLAMLFRFLIGLSSTLCFLSAARLASRWFPTERLAFVIGVIVTMAMLGGFVAQTPMTFLVSHIGWRAALLTDAVLGVVFLGIIIKNVYDFPPDYKAQHVENLRELTALGFWPSIGKALRNIQNWLAGLYTSLLNLPIFIIGSSFGSLYLQQVHHYSKTTASFCSSMIFLGTIVGSPVLGGLSDRIGRRCQPMIIAAIISLVLMVLLMQLNQPDALLMGLLIFLLGFFTSAQIIGYPLIAESNPRALTSTSIGVGSVLIMGGGAVFEPLFGYLLNLHWDHAMVNGVAQYSAKDFNLALLILPITMVVGILAACLAKETYCRVRK